MLTEIKIRFKSVESLLVHNYVGVLIMNLPIIFSIDVVCENPQRLAIVINNMYEANSENEL